MAGDERAKRGRLIASTAEGLFEVSAENGCARARMTLAGAGALCCGCGALYCAADDGAVWRIDPVRFAPTALFSGGPGISALCLDERSERLFVLCSGADSLLLCCARTGQALLLNHAGLNPQGMTHVRESGMIAVAGGEQEAVLLYDENSLRLVDAVAMPGIVCAAAACAGRIHALCMDESMNTLLVTDRGYGRAAERKLPGLPGMLKAEDGCLLAAAQDRLYAVAQDNAAILSCMRMPGRAGKLFDLGGGCAAMLDSAAQTLYLRRGARWRRVLEGARDAVRLRVYEGTG